MEQYINIEFSCPYCMSKNVDFIIANNRDECLLTCNYCQISSTLKEIYVNYSELKKYVKIIGDQKRFFRTMYKKYKDKKKRCPICERVLSKNNIMVDFYREYGHEPCKYCHMKIFDKDIMKSLVLKFCIFERLYNKMKEAYLNNGQKHIEKMKK